MPTVTLDGSLTVSDACSGSCSDSGSATELLSFGPGTCTGRSATAHTGFTRRTVSVASPSWLALGEVGPTSTVAQGDFFYLRTTAPISIRYTVDDGAGGTRTYIEDVDAFVAKTFPTSKPLELVEVQGSATITFFASGQS